MTGCFRSCKIIEKLLLHLDIGGHGDCSTKLFGSHKLCYYGQLPLTDHYFKRCNTKLYVSVATFSINANIKFWEHLKQEFQKPISWTKYKSKITRQTKSNYLDYMIDPTFKNIIGCCSLAKMILI